MALNYDSLANFEDGTCLFPNLGCTDPLSLNYDDSATMDDGSCDYCAEGIEYVAQIQMNIINSCEEGYVLDCDGSGECHPESWIGDGYADCEDQQYGADLSCYDSDGGDCSQADSDGFEWSGNDYIISNENGDNCKWSFITELFGL